MSSYGHLLNCVVYRSQRFALLGLVWLILDQYMQYIMYVCVCVPDLLRYLYIDLCVKMNNNAKNSNI